MSNPRGFAEWFVKTQPKETVEKLSQLTSKLRLPGPRDRHSGEKEGEGDLAQDSSETQFENQTDIYSFGLHAVMEFFINTLWIDHAGYDFKYPDVGDRAGANGATSGDGVPI